MSESRYLLATRSAGKLRELRPLFARYHLPVIDLLDAGILEHAEEADIERFDTFEENARAKAEYFYRRSGIPTFADDSGLVVDVLGGEPGVRSKRWSGRDDLDGQALDDANNAKLFQEIAALSLPVGVSYKAGYRCAAALTDSRGTVIRIGQTAGVIVPAPVGTHGFGYDPYFFSAELGMTFGEAETSAKNAISHRGRAFASLLSDGRRPRALQAVVHGADWYRMNAHQAGPRLPLHPPEDGDLLARVCSQDEAVAGAAFEEVYAREYPVVWKFAYRFVGSRDAAQDLTQDVFVSVWERRLSLRIHGSLRTYLLAAVRLRAIDVVRRQITERTAVEQLRAGDPFVGMGVEGERPDEAAAVALTEERIRRALVTLPERQRSALVLRWEHGLSNREIAQALGIGEAAVSRLLARAAEALRGVM